MQENKAIINPAEQAALESLEKVLNCIRERKNFRLEAGAGAGKTYSLIKALRYLIKEEENHLSKSGKRIACITYTEVARDEIRSRIDNSPIVMVETIHAFSWNLIKNFQKAMRELIPTLNDKWPEKIAEAGGINLQTVVYSLGYAKITSEQITLHHDDVIKLFTQLLEQSKFRAILTSLFPVIFIDEYQDTNKELAEGLVRNFILVGGGPLIGLFGDHWQQIYNSDSCGLIQAPAENLYVIDKNANFRSDRLIVESLNRMRHALPQQPSDPTSEGEVRVFHSNSWNGTRLSGGHTKGDLPEKEAHEYLEKTKAILESQGWNFNPDFTKILMLTNNVLASEQGYRNLVDIFKYTDDYLKKSDDYISFFVDVVEAGCDHYHNKKYGDMFKAFGVNTPKIKSHSDKAEWNKNLVALQSLRESGTIGDILDLLHETKRPRLSAKIEDKEARFRNIENVPNENLDEKDLEFKLRQTKMRKIQYSEMIALNNYLTDKTPFSTKHGVKGAQFENVLVVCGRGWNQYNWTQMLEWAGSNVPTDKQTTFERSRNLFYVASSRPKKRLAFLFTQELSQSAIKTLNNWFGEANIVPLDL